MDDHPVHTKPPPYQNRFFPKTFFQIILAAKWFVWHSRTSPKQQLRPLPTLLSLFFFYDSSSNPTLPRTLPRQEDVIDSLTSCRRFLAVVDSPTRHCRFPLQLLSIPLPTVVDSSTRCCRFLLQLSSIPLPTVVDSSTSCRRLIYQMS